MNVLKRTKDFKLLAVEALIRHLQPALRTHGRIQRELSIRSSGYYGEKNVDYMLRTYPHKDALVLPDTRLAYKNYDFQLDSIILTPQTCIILETKNWAGELEYDSALQQLTQFNGGQKKRYRCPMAQVETQKRNLTGWLLEHNFPSIPVETFVVISNSATILNNPHQDSYFSEKVFHADLLHEKLDKLFSTTRELPSFVNPVKGLPEKMNANKVYRYEDILSKFDISKSQLVEGLICEGCWNHTLIRKGHNWICTQCGHADKKAYVQAIYDYFLLNQMQPVTNRELRSFLKLPSRHIVYSLVKHMNLKMTHTKRHAIYHAPALEQFPQNSNLPSL